jgi:cytoskeleton protein RodZ
MSSNAVADLTPVGGAPSQHVRFSPEPRASAGAARGGRKFLSAVFVLGALGLAGWWLWQQWLLHRAAARPSVAMTPKPTQNGNSISIPVVIPGAGTGINEPSGAARAKVPVTTTSTGAAESSPAQAAPPKPPAAPATLGVIRFEFSGAARVTVRDKNDFVIHEELHKPADITEIQVRPPIGLVIGNAKNVKMLFNGRPIDLTPYTHVSVARFTLSDPE